MLAEFKIYDIPSGAGQRAIADMIENDIVDQIVAKGGIRPKSVRTIEDVTLNDVLIDVKTKDLSREFSMPNLISVDRLKKNRDKEIAYFFVDYVVNPVDRMSAQPVNMEYRLIESISWDHLKIQNLGLGQLQLSDYKDGIKRFDGTKDEWFEELEVQMDAFYTKQIAKFEKLRSML